MMTRRTHLKTAMAGTLGAMLPAAEVSIEFLQQKQDKPFLPMFGGWRPQTPLTSPRRFFEMYDPAEISVSPPGYREGDLDDVPTAWAKALGGRLG
jgi:hypothetical protein